MTFLQLITTGEDGTVTIVKKRIVMSQSSVIIHRLVTQADQL